jgi:hypothetical protein
MAPADPTVEATEQLLLAYFKEQMPDYEIEIGVGDLDTRASSFRFDKDNQRTVLFLYRDLVNQHGDAAIELLEKYTWRDAVRKNPNTLVWVRTDRINVVPM